MSYCIVHRLEGTALTLEFHLARRASRNLACTVARMGHGAQKITISGPDIIARHNYVWPRDSIFSAQ